MFYRESITLRKALYIFNKDWESSKSFDFYTNKLKTCLSSLRSQVRSDMVSNRVLFICALAHTKGCSVQYATQIKFTQDS